MKWFTDALWAENDSKEYLPTPRSITLIEIASQVIGVEQAD